MAARSDDEIEELVTPPALLTPRLTPFVPPEQSPIEEMPDSLNSRRSVFEGFDVEAFTRRHLNCPRCGQYYNDPRTLPCLDTYCKNCLEELAREKRQEKLAQIQKEEEEEEEEEGEQVFDQDDNYLESLRSSFNITPCSSILEEETENAPLPNKKYIDLDNFYCPQGCEATTGVKIGEEGHVYQLPDCNLFLKNLVNTVRLKEELPQRQISCQNCDVNAEAIAVCNNKECANIPLCAECLTAHLRAKETKEHNVIYASSKYKENLHHDGCHDDSSHSDGRHSDGHHSDSRHGNSSFNGRSEDPNEEPPDSWKNFDRRSWHCHKHPTELVDRYCYNHQETLCMRCQLVSGPDGHWKCNNIKETEACVEEEEGLLRDLLSEVAVLHHKIKRGIENIELMKVALMQDKDWILNTINERCIDIVDNIERQRDELVNQTKRTCTLKMGQLDESLNCLQRISDTFTRSAEFIRGSMQMAIPTEFMFLREGFHQRLNYLKNNYANCHNNLSTDLNSRIYLKLNDNFDPQGAIGQVHGTPFVEAFTLDKFPPVVRAQNCYPFEIKCRDICHEPLVGMGLPPLKATIERPNEEPVECFVKPDTKSGTYAVYMYPFTPGPYRVSVFNVQTGPFEDLVVRGFPISFNVRQ